MAIRKSIDGTKAALAGGAAGGAATEENPLRTDPGDGRGRTHDAARTGLSLRVAEPAAELAAEPGVRADKVAMVRAGLAAGSYNVPAWAVASKMTRLGWAARHGRESLWNEVPLSGEALADSDFETAQAILHDVERLRELRAKRLDYSRWQTLNWIAGRGKYGYN